MEVLNGVMVFMMTINFWGGLLIVEEMNILMAGHEEGVTFMKLTKHYVERYFERVLENALPNDRGPLDLESMVKGDMDLRMDARQINNMSFIIFLVYYYKYVN